MQQPLSSTLLDPYKSLRGPRLSATILEWQIGIPIMWYGLMEENIETNWHYYWLYYIWDIARRLSKTLEAYREATMAIGNNPTSMDRETPRPEAPLLSRGSLRGVPSRSKDVLYFPSQAYSRLDRQICVCKSPSRLLVDPGNRKAAYSRPCRGDSAVE